MATIPFFEHYKPFGAAAKLLRPDPSRGETANNDRQGLQSDDCHYWREVETAQRWQ
jgi:hypothetical protein